MTQHTSGPWKVIDRRPHFGIVPSKGSGVISTIPSNASRTNDEKQANARLIAAAPELLKALEEILESANEGDCYCEVGEGYHAISCLVVIAGMAKAAIKKAKGEQS